MRIQQKLKLTPRQAEILPAVIKKNGGQFVRSVLGRDYIFTPDNRAFVPRFIERYALTGKDRGLFLRIREENDLTSRQGIQALHLYAYKVADDCLMDDQIATPLHTDGNTGRELTRLLEMLGLDKVIEVTKKRDEYELIHQTISFGLKIDSVEGLPETYLEIHSYSEKTETAPTLEAMSQLKDALGMSDEIPIGQTYFQMLLQSVQPL